MKAAFTGETFPPSPISALGNFVFWWNANVDLRRMNVLTLAIEISAGCNDLWKWSCEPMSALFIERFTGSWNGSSILVYGYFSDILRPCGSLVSLYISARASEMSASFIRSVVYRREANTNTLIIQQGQWHQYFMLMWLVSTVSAFRKVIRCHRSHSIWAAQWSTKRRSRPTNILICHWG